MNFIPKLVESCRSAQNSSDSKASSKKTTKKLVDDRVIASDSINTVIQVFDEVTHSMIATHSKIIVADDHPLFRDAISQILPQIVGDCEIESVESFQQLYALLNENPDVDLVLMDLHMPGNKGFMGLATIKAEFPAVAVVMVSASESSQIVQRALSLGVSGYIPKSAGFEIIKEALNRVLEGEIWLPESIKTEVELIDSHSQDAVAKIASLTPQQLKVLSMISDGMLNKQIAYELNIQETTIKHHVSAILRKLDVNNRTLAGIMYKELQVEDESQELKKA